MAKKQRRPRKKPAPPKVAPSPTNTIPQLVRRIKKSPQFVPSFRSEIPLGMTDDMLALSRYGFKAVPTLKELLNPSNKDPVRQAAVVMLAYANASEAEELVRASLADAVTRPVALICLGNYLMRSANSPFSNPSVMLREQELGLLEVLDYIEDDTLVTLDSGFEVYQGPVADLAMAAAIRLTGLDPFCDIIDPEDYRYIGLIPYNFQPFIAKNLQDRLQEQRERLRNLMRGITEHGTITTAERNTPRGKEFSLTFDHDSTKCTCSKIGWIQIARVIAPGGEFRYPTGKEIDDTDGDGWFLDQHTGYPNPAYVTNNTGAAIPLWGQFGKCNGAEKNATLKDIPDGPPGTKLEYEACIFCLDGVGADAGTCYGCFKWTMEVLADRSKKYGRLGASSKPSSQFEKSAREWNALPGRTDTPDPGKW